MPRDDVRTLQLLRQHGRTATAFQVLAPGISHWFAPTRPVRSDAVGFEDSGKTSDDSDRGVVGYSETGGAWVATGEPVAARADTIEVAEMFVAAADAHGKRVAFFATEGALAASHALDAFPGRAGTLRAPR